MHPLWDSIHYWVNIGGRFSKKENRYRKHILRGVSGEVRPGQMVAIMGASGAGKTTLLNILAGRVADGQIDGEILVNDLPRKSNWKKVVGYVQQEDILSDHCLQLKKQ